MKAPFIEGQGKHCAATGRIQYAYSDEAYVAEVRPGVKGGADVGANPNCPAGERDRHSAVPVTRDGHNLWKIRHKPEGIECAKSECDEI